MTTATLPMTSSRVRQPARTGAASRRPAWRPLLAVIVLALVVAWQALTIHSMFSSHSASGAPVLSVGWSWRPTGWEATYTDGTKAVHLVW